MTPGVDSGKRSWLELGVELEDAHQRFVRVCEHLSPDLYEKSGACGEWSPRQVVAHIIGWDVEAVHYLARFASDNGESYNPNFDVDEFNARSVGKRVDSSWEACLAELSRAHAAIQQIVRLIDAQGRDPSSGFARGLAGRIADYKLHTDQLAVWL